LSPLADSAAERYRFRRLLIGE